MKTKYEKSWDQYSKTWDKQQGDALGVEWGTDALTQAIHDRFLAPHLTADTVALEIGPGGGKYSALAAPLCKELICTDVSQEMLDRTRDRLGKESNMRTVKLNGLDLTGIADGSVDFGFSIDVFVHLDIEDIYVYLREFLRILKPGSRLVLHFADLSTDTGWDFFVREADINRAQFKQIGRISFLSADLVRRMFEKVGFNVEVFDEEITVRDFVVQARKPHAPADPHAAIRAERIVERSGGGKLYRDLLTEMFTASVRTAPKDYLLKSSFDVHDDTREVLFAHPPAWIGYPITIPPRGRLISAVAIDPKAWERSYADGIEFRVLARIGTQEHVLFETTVAPNSNEAHRGWVPVDVDLSKYANKVALLVLETRIGEGTNEYNWCGWAEPGIVVS